MPLIGTISGEVEPLLDMVRLPEKLPAEAGANPTLNDVAPPAGTENGTARPDRLKGVPLVVTCVTWSVADPGFCTMTVDVLVTPMTTFPKLTLEGVTAMSGCTPAPFSDTADGELVAVLTTLTVPETLPTTAGANATTSERAWPGVRVTAPEKPLTPNPAPVQATDEIVTLAVPLFVRLIAFEELVPTS